MKAYLRSYGNFDNTEKFLKRLSKRDYLAVLDECGKQGVAALASATPKDSGSTSKQWYYDIETTPGSTQIVWKNDAKGEGWFEIAIGLQYGHGTGTGGYVKGIDYINPAIRPVFDNITETVWKVIRSS